MGKVIFAAVPFVLFACGGAEGGPSPQSTTATEQASAAEVEAIDGGVDGGKACTTKRSKEPTCKEDYALFKAAKAACEAGGTFLNAFAADESCGAGSSLTYSSTCCETKEACTNGGGAGGLGCESDGDLFVSAEGACTGGSIASFKPTQDTCTKKHGDGFDVVCSCL